MDSQKLVDNTRTILKSLFLDGKISYGQFHQLENLVLDIRVKASSELVMDSTIYHERVQKYYRPGGGLHQKNSPGKEGCS